MAGFPFVDPISGLTCTLKIDFEAATIGVAHPDCEQLADVSIHLDSFYCQTCRWNGRISGAWVAHLIERPVDERAAIAADMATAHTEDTSALVVGFTGTDGTGVLIHSVPAVSIDGRTIVIVRDDTDLDGGGTAHWITFDVDNMEEIADDRWWASAAEVRHYADQLDAEITGARPDVDLWATVAAIVEQAEQT